MKMSRTLLSCVALACVLAGPDVGRAEGLRVACVGDSITAGARVDAATESYPARLQVLLGESHEVKNFGVGGATLVKTGRPSIWSTIGRVQEFQPHVVVISLGTNDTVGREDHWGQNARFNDDFSLLIHTLSGPPTRPRIVLCTPTAMVLETPGLSPARLASLRERRPRLQELCRRVRELAARHAGQNVSLLELNAVLQGKPDLLTRGDGVHPNVAGHLAIARAVAGEVAARVDRVGRFVVAEGLDVQPFAIQGQLSNPASIDVDDRGRVWVGEAVNYRKKARRAGDRILILEDSNGDGRADTTRVFYQDPDIDGVHGVCTLGNMAIVSAPDRVLLLTDTDGDDRADAKKLLFKGRVTQGPHGQHDHAVHAVMFGPDGRLYFNFGNFNAGLWRADGTQVKDVFGNPVNNSRRPYQEGMVIRCEPDGSRVEVLGYNFRNNWEVTVDSFGSMWQSDNDNGSSSCRVNFVMEYGNYGYRDERTGADYRSERTNMEAAMQRRMWHQNDPGVVPNLLITGAGAPTGILVYEGDLLPEPFRGQMIHAEPGRNVVWGFPTQPSGAGYSARIVDVVRSTVDRNYRPSDVSVAPDGSLFIADWFDPVDCCHRTINDAGRIFRVAPPRHPYTIPAHEYRTPAGAARALRSPNLSTRYRAWTALLGFKTRARPALETMATDENPRLRARALWALAAIKGGVADAIETALQDDSEDVRALALRIARRHRLPVEPVVRRSVRDESALVRRECAVSLHRLTSAEAVELWVELAARHDGKDRWYLEALGIGEKGKETACLEAWLEEIGDDWKTPVGRDIIWRSRAPEAADLLARLLLDPEVPPEEHPRLLRALDFHSGPRQEAALAAVLLGDSRRVPATYLEAFQRATAEFVEAHPEVMRRVESALLVSKGTVTFVDLVARFDRRDLIDHLMDMARADPQKEPGIRAARQVLTFGEGRRISSALQKPDQGWGVLRGVATDDARPEAVRLLAVTSLGRSSAGARTLMQLVRRKELPGEFLPSAIRSLSLSPGPDTRLFAAQQQELLAPVADRWPMERLLAAEPDTAKGSAVFHKAGCVACHVVGGEGLDFGPELSDIGTRLSPEQLFAAILNPSQTISLGYEGVLVQTKDGVQLVGFVSGENRTTLSLRVPGGLQKDLPKARITVRQAMKASLMPDGLDVALSSRELVDLVGWLRTLRVGKKREQGQE